MSFLPPAPGERRKRRADRAPGARNTIVASPPTLDLQPKNFPRTGLRASGDPNSRALCVWHHGSPLARGRPDEEVQRNGKLHLKMRSRRPRGSRRKAAIERVVLARHVEEKLGRREARAVLLLQPLAQGDEAVRPHHVD